VVSARFLLTHLADPLALLQHVRGYLRAGRLVVVEDIDIRGRFAAPDCPALDRSVEWYSRTVRNRGGDPDIGPRLPSLLRDAGFEDVRLRMFHPVAMEVGVKRLICVTLERIGASVIEDGLATRSGPEQILSELEAFARDRGSLMGSPRVFQVWGQEHGGRLTARCGQPGLLANASAGSTAITGVAAAPIPVECR
jgi:hypothetical protein